MRIILSTFAVLWLTCLMPSHAQSAGDVPSFQTNATITFNGDPRPLSTVIATVRPSMFAGYYWMWFHFYSFAPTASDMPSISKGDTKSMDHQLSALMDQANNASIQDPANSAQIAAQAHDKYNKGRANVKLTLDKDFKVVQVDAGVPGLTCTLTEPSVKDIAPSFKITGNRASFKANGTYACIPMNDGKDDKFGLNLNVDAQVYKEQ